VHLVGFIMRMYHEARSSECQNETSLSVCCSFTSSVHCLGYGFDEWSLIPG